MEKDNSRVNKDLLNMRSKIQTFIRGYDKYTAKLKSKIEVLEAENKALRDWKQRQLAGGSRKKGTHNERS